MDNWKYDHYINQLQRTIRKVHENFVVSSLIHDPRLDDLLPLTQHYLRRDEKSYALVDLYYPQLHMVIEIDEPHHEGYRDHDIKRQNDIEKRNKCDFWRIDISGGDVLLQINALKQSLLERKKLLEEKNGFVPWMRPRSTTFEDLQASLENTLFVKIRGKIAEDKLLARQTGAWSLDERKRLKVKQVVVVHDRVVSRVFRKVRWEPTPGRKWMFVGTEVEDLEFVGSLLNGWNYQSTRVYSNDIEGRVGIES